VTGKAVLTPAAKADVAEAAAWCRGRSIRAADNFLLAISVALARIERQPTAQVVVDADTGVRRALLRKFPHRVLYLIDGERLVVVAVMHHGRNKPERRERLG
jgi:plasmid stabilization system protein ParE